MAYSLWMFAKPNDGQPVRRVPLRLYEKFYEGTLAIPAQYLQADGWVYFVQLPVELRDRKPVSIFQPMAVKHKAGKGRKLDRDQHRKDMATEVGTVSFFADDDFISKSAHRFAIRRRDVQCRWVLRTEDLRAMEAAVKRVLSKSELY